MGEQLKFSFCAAWLSIITYMYGNSETCIKLLAVLTYFVFLDLAFGIIAHLYTKTFEYKKIYFGLLKKAGEFLLISVMYKIDTLGINFIQLQPAFLWAFLGYEAYSIFKNFNLFGFILPAWATDLLKQLPEQFKGGKL